MAISRRLRYEILRRDNHTCRYCGGAAPEVKLTVDHVVPVTLGGNDDPGNLVAACQDCNAGKSSMPVDAPLVEDVSQDALRWKRAIEQAIHDRAEKSRQEHAYVECFLDVWHQFNDVMGREKPLPDEWRDSVVGFYRNGLPIHELVDAVHLAMQRDRVGTWDKFRYVAGICWNKLRELQDAAHKIIAEGGA